MTVSAIFILIALHIHVRSAEQRAGWAQAEYRAAQSKMLIEIARREEKEQFLAMLTHELKTPLSVAIMNLGISRITDEMKTEVIHALDEIGMIIDRCIQADRIDGAKQSITPSRFNPDHEIEQIGEKHTLSGRLKLELGCEIALTTDILFYRTIVSNLVDNAIKYKHPESVAVLKTTAEQWNGQSGFLMCVDTIPGAVGYPDPEKLFTKYYRSPGAQAQSGTGIGLFVARELTTRLGGTLKYKRMGDLVSFILWLPA